MNLSFLLPSSARLKTMYDQRLYLENKQHNQSEIAQRKSILESKARRLMVVLTGRCNIDCIMCERKESNFTLPKAAVEQIVELFPYLESIMWQGGEVFLIDYFKEFFEKAAGYPQLLQEINTNGLLLTPDWATIIASANARLIFSIDSTDPDIYEYIRKGADFRTLINNLTVLKAARSSRNKNSAVDIINVVVMRSNYRSLEAFVDFALEYGLGSINFMYMVGRKCPEENIFNPPEKEAIAYLDKTIPEIIARAKASGIHVNCEFMEYLSSAKASQQKLNSGVAKEALFCSLPWKSLFIDATSAGKVYPECLCLQPVGELSNNTLKEIWNNSAMQLYRKRLAGGELADWCNPHCIRGLVNKNFLSACENL